MNQDTGWFNSYSKYTTHDHRHRRETPSRYKAEATITQPNQQAAWGPLPPGPPPPLVGYNMGYPQLNPYGCFVANQFRPAYPPSNFTSYGPNNSNYNNNSYQAPRMRHGNNNFGMQRRYVYDKSKTYNNNNSNNSASYHQQIQQNNNPSMSRTEEEPCVPKIEQHNENESQAQQSSSKFSKETFHSSSKTVTQSNSLDARPSSSNVSVADDDEDDVVICDTKPQIKEEDVKPSIDCIDLSDDADCPEEKLNKFHFESRTQALQKLCGTLDEGNFLVGLRQFKVLLENQRGGISLKLQFMQLLTKYILFLGMNYKVIASGFVDEYLDLMEDIIVLFCQEIRDFIIMQIERKKRRHLGRLATNIKYLMSHSLLYRMDSIMHCLFKVQLYPYEEEHCLMWTDVFLYFLKKVKYEPKNDDLLRIFIAWKKLKTIRAATDAEMIDECMYKSLGKSPEELKSIPLLNKFLEEFENDPRYSVREMLNKYWKWRKEERPKEIWADLEEPTTMQLPGEFDQEFFSPSDLLNQTSSQCQDDEISSLFEGRRTGKKPGLKQLAKERHYLRQPNLFYPSNLGNIFDDSSTNLDYFGEDFDNNDLVIVEPKVVDTIEINSDEENDDVIIVDSAEQLQNASRETEKTTAAVEKLMEESNIIGIYENIREDEESIGPKDNSSVKTFGGSIIEEPIETSFTSESNLEGLKVLSSNETSENPKENVKNKNENSKLEISNRLEAFFNCSDSGGNEKDNVDLNNETDAEKLDNENEDIVAPRPTSRNNGGFFDDWDDEWSNPEILEHLDKGKPKERSTTTKPNDENYVTLLERPSQFGAGCTEPFNFDGSDIEDDQEKTNESVKNPEKTYDESNKTETLTQRENMEIVPEKTKEISSKNTEALPEKVQELPIEHTTKITENLNTEDNVLREISMTDLSEVLNVLDKDVIESKRHEENLSLKEVPHESENHLPNTLLLRHGSDFSVESGEFVEVWPTNTDISNFPEKLSADEPEDLNKNNHYAAIVQAACFSDEENNEFAMLNGNYSNEEAEIEVCPKKSKEAVLDHINAIEANSEKRTRLLSTSDEISSPACESLDKNEVREHFDAETNQNSFNWLANNIVTTTANTVTKESIINVQAVSSCQLNPKETITQGKPVSPNLIEADEHIQSTPVNQELTLDVQESASVAPINLENLSSPNPNTDIITAQSPSIESLKTKDVEEEPKAQNFLSNSDVSCDKQNLDKSLNHLAVPQREDHTVERPPPSGSQPYSPPSIRIGNAVSALDENNIMLYTPILQDSQTIQPAIVPDVLPQQDLPKQNAVPPPKPDTPTTKANNNNSIGKIKIVKVSNPLRSPADGKSVSAELFEEKSKEIFAIVYGSKNFNNSDKCEELPEKANKKKGRRISFSKDNEATHIKSKKGEPNAKTNKGKKASDKLTRNVNADDNKELFEYAIEGPTGKPLWNSAPNMLWDDDEDLFKNDKQESFKSNSNDIVPSYKTTTPIAVKSDKQLKKNEPTLVSILKKRKVVKNYNKPRLIIKLTPNDRISDIYNERAKEIAEELKKQQIKIEAEQRAHEMACLRMLKAQQDKHESGGILRCIFGGMDEDKRVFVKPTKTRKVRFEGVTDEHSYRNYRNSEHTPEKRKQDDPPTDVTPHKKTRITVRTDLIEGKINKHFPIKISTPTKKSVKSLKFAENKESPVPATKPNGVSQNTRETTQNQTKNARIARPRRKTTGKDSCDVTESKPGRRKRANNF